MTHTPEPAPLKDAIVTVLHFVAKYPNSLTDKETAAYRTISQWLEHVSTMMWTDPKRMFDCTKALAGLNPEHIPELIQACEHLLRPNIDYGMPSVFKLNRVSDALAKVKSNETQPPV